MLKQTWQVPNLKHACWGVGLSLVGLVVTLLFTVTARMMEYYLPSWGVLASTLWWLGWVAFLSIVAYLIDNL